MATWMFSLLQMAFFFLSQGFYGNILFKEKKKTGFLSMMNSLGVPSDVPTLLWELRFARWGALSDSYNMTGLTSCPSGCIPREHVMPKSNCEGCVRAGLACSPVLEMLSPVSSCRMLAPNLCFPRASPIIYFHWLSFFWGSVMCFAG